MRMRKSAVGDQELIARIAKSKVKVERAGEDRKRVGKAGAPPPYHPFFLLSSLLSERKKVRFFGTKE